MSKWKMERPQKIVRQTLEEEEDSEEEAKEEQQVKLVI
jgi:hypothetical protein